MARSYTRLNRRALLACVPAAAAGLSAAQSSIPGAKAPRPSTGNPGTQFYDEQESREVAEALRSRTLFRWYGPSKPEKVGSFEKAFAEYMGAKYALAVTSGTAALHCALTALGVGPGDEVILPAWAWYACYNTILMTGALPVFAENDETLNIDPADVEKKITPQTKAIMVLHLYGCAADMDKILAIARRHNVRVLEDTAQGLGAQYKGKRLGTLGDIGIYSFQISKTITSGEGGAVVANDPALFERAARFHDLGLLRPPHEALLGAKSMSGFVGVNYRMNELTGAVMCAQLRKLDTIVAAFRRNARYVRDNIQGLPGLELRRLPDPDGEIGSAVFVFLKSKQARDAFLKAMRAEKASAGAPGASLYLPAVPHIEQKVAVHPAWPSFNTPRGKAIRYGAGCCPRTVELYDRCASIPIGPKDTQENLQDLVAAIKKASRAV
ncbi:MAG TPA: DegT/DnrJ/EryC1/StrS family aminotransferase [Bryobacteraceae bacterium]|nr:DegT/DnrJ/EryC1/StrS family aminotransferase [Bryobacteraceae bacterium]